MKSQQRRLIVRAAALILGMAFATSCSQIGSINPIPTSTPTVRPSSTSSQTRTLTPTLTPAPTQTPSPSPTTAPSPTRTAIDKSSTVAPRWVVLGLPGYPTQILGEYWDYFNDVWSESFACIRYQQGDFERWFEQCFVVNSAGNPTYDDHVETFIGFGFQQLIPMNDFDLTGDISLFGKKETDSIIFFEVVGTDQFTTLVEMHIVTDEDPSLQDYYHEQAADVMDYVLQSSLLKSGILPAPTPTPLSPQQESIYQELAPNLISASEASALNTGLWEALGDKVPSDRIQVCRYFENRTNADVRWILFINCVGAGDGLDFEEITEFYAAGETQLKSSHPYENDILIYGYGGTPTIFDAWLLDGDRIYFVSLELRTILGDTVEDLFAEGVDEFIYQVFMVNLEN